MRLIDADKLKELPWMIDRGMNDANEEYVTMEGIDSQETIEAIPIEWIREKSKDYMNNLWYEQSIRYMLDVWYSENREWEKENE